VLQPATLSAETTLEIARVLSIGAAVIFIGVMGLFAMALAHRGARPVNAWIWVAGGGIAFPVVVLSALLVYSTVRSLQLRELNAASLVVEVSGVQWWWEVTYRDLATGREIRSANELRVPVGRPVTLGLTTADVIHSFWVPALGGKVDMIPGRVRQLQIQVAQPGVYRGVCAEFCGDQHAKMVLHVVAVAPDEFDRWMMAQAEPASSPNSATARRGQQLFTELRCNACHAVRGVAEAPRIAPDLTHVASRLTIGAGELPTQADSFRRWIADIQHIKPGARMPAFDHLDQEALTALAAFLDGLK
jgi:cytochrome c oxidase subunit 2